MRLHRGATWGRKVGPTVRVSTLLSRPFSCLARHMCLLAPLATACRPHARLTLTRAPVTLPFPSQPVAHATFLASVSSCDAQSLAAELGKMKTWTLERVRPTSSRRDARPPCCTASPPLLPRTPLAPDHCTDPHHLATYPPMCQRSGGFAPFRGPARCHGRPPRPHQQWPAG